MNHGVTAGYIVIDAKRLRVPMQMITDHLKKLMGIKVTENENKTSHANEKSGKGMTAYEETA